MLARDLSRQENQQVQGLGQYITLAQQTGIRINPCDNIVDEVLHRVGFHKDTRFLDLSSAYASYTLLCLRLL